MKYELQLPEQTNIKYLSKHNQDEHFILCCKYFKINQLGICFCKKKKKGYQKFKNENPIGTCYSIYSKHKIHDYKLFKDNLNVWAVTHLQHNETTNKELAFKIVHHLVD